MDHAKWLLNDRWWEGRGWKI